MEGLVKTIKADILATIKAKASSITKAEVIDRFISNKYKNSPSININKVDLTYIYRVEVTSSNRNPLVRLKTILLFRPDNN